MIKYQLRCAGEHEFEGWFRDSADFDAQAAQKLVQCPVCASEEVRKAVMAPAVARRSPTRNADVRRDIVQAMNRARDYVEKNFDYVGDQFPEQARKIHYGESDPRGIYGEATGKEVKELVEEGVKVAPLPGAPKKNDKAGPPRIATTGDKKLN
jgi:hypothetical protein